MPEAIRLIDKIQDMSDFNGDSFVDGQFMVWDAANQRFTSTEFITQSDGITITAGAGRTALVVNGGDVDFGGGKHCLSSNGLIHLFGLGNPDATDKEQLQLGWDTTTSTYKIQTRKSGSGVLRKLYIHSDGTVIQQQSSQTNNLLEFQNTSGVVLSYVTAAGVFNGDGSGLTNLTATNINGAVPITNGGTGQITANAALNALLPSQTSNSSKYLQTDGTNTSWASVAQADPTASVGLSAVNGSASTFMRSDAAPALSQSIVPTWTGLHTFQAQTSAKAAIFKAAATTPGNITEWQSSSGTALSWVASDGSVVANRGMQVYSNIGGNPTFDSGYSIYGNILRSVNSSAIALDVRGNSTQNVNVVSVKPYATGTAVFVIDNVGIITLQPDNAANKVLVVKGAPSQSANIQEWQNSSGTVLSSVSSLGVFSGPGSGAGTNSERFGASSVVSGNYGVAFGNTASVTTDYSVAVGQAATASGTTNCVAVGYACTASGQNSIAIGRGVTSSGQNCYTLGQNMTNSGTNSVVINGTGASNNIVSILGTAGAVQTVAIGSSSSASATNCVAIGYNTSASNTGSICIGASSTSSSSNTIAIGSTTTASGGSCIAIGSSSTASSTSGIAIGVSSSATGGTGTTVIGVSAVGVNRATAVGYTATANVDASTAIGYGTQATATSAIAVGHAANCSGAGIAIGSSAVSSAGGGAGGIAIGSSAQANAGGNNIAIGGSTVAGHNYAICLGFGATSTAANQMMIGSTTGPTNSMVFVSGGTTTISVAAPVQAAGSTAGRNIALSASNAIGGSSTQNAAAGGAVTITAGNAARTDTNSGAALGGSITLTAGDGIGTSAGGSAGSINLVGGNCNINNAGAVNITGGNGSGSGTGGYVNITGGTGATTSGGYIVLLSGSGGAGVPTGNITLTTPANAGSSAGSQSGSISVTTGNTAGTSSASGSISLTVGTNSSSSGTCGGISMTTGGFSGTNAGAGTTGSFTITIPSGPDTTPNSSSNPSAGSFTLTVGNGGSTTGINSTAGNGGSVTLIAGNGGNATATSGSTTNGGNGGNVTIRAGSGGTAFNTAGTVGQVLMQVSGGTTVMTLSPSTQNVLIQTSAANVVGQVIKATASQSSNLQEWQDNSANILSTISENGYYTTRKNSAPADAELSSGELALWFDSTNGAGKLMIKAKTANGTVVTGQVALS
jgi:hypothetical protein